MPATMQEHPTSRVAELKRHETPRANVANAEMIIAGLLSEAAYSMEHDAIEALKGVHERLQAAREALDEDRRIAQSIIGAARSLDAERKLEIRALQDQLREAQETIRHYGDGHWHLRVSWGDEQYVVERRWIAGVYTDWELAKTHVRKLRAQGKAVIDHTNQAVLSAAGD